MNALHNPTKLYINFHHKCFDVVLKEGETKIYTEEVVADLLRVYPFLEGKEIEVKKKEVKKEKPKKEPKDKKPKAKKKKK